MCGSPSVANQLWKGFLCCPVAVFCSSPSRLPGGQCNGALPPCETLQKTFVLIQPRRKHFQQKMTDTLDCKRSSSVFAQMNS